MPRCLEFYYYLTSSSGELNVRAEAPVTWSSTPKRYPLFSRNHDHDSLWWKGTANIGLTSKYRIVFEALTGKSPDQGIIALDDVTIRDGACSAQKGTCDFENNDLCNWVNMPDAELNWLLNQGQVEIKSN